MVGLGIELGLWVAFVLASFAYPVLYRQVS
jgi:hypothetical protein